MENEVWKPIIGYEGLYEVSNKGRVKSLKRKVENRTNLIEEKIMKQVITTNGYYKITLSNQKSSTKLVHRLVAEAFIPNLENKKCVNHIDCNRLNNNLENLEWATHSENNHLPFVQGRRVNNLIVKHGEDNHNSKLTNQEVINIRAMYIPYKISASKIAKIYNVCTATIEKILENKTYKNAKVKE